MGRFKSGDKVKITSRTFEGGPTYIFYGYIVNGPEKKWSIPGAGYEVSYDNTYTGGRERCDFSENDLELDIVETREKKLKDLGI